MVTIAKVNKAVGEPDKGYIRGFGYDIIDRLLLKTRGFMPYQENLMELIGQILFSDEVSSPAEALQHGDIVRRVVAKKKEKEIPALKDKWFVSCKKHSIDKETAEVLWNEVEASAGYQFNQAHAADYSLYSAQLAWFRYHYPIQFAAQRLNVKDSEKDVWLRYCAINNIEVREPRINTSTTEWKVKNDVIYAPIQIVQGLANKAEKIARKQPFASVKDFDERLTGLECNSSNKLALWMLGFFEGLEGSFDDLTTPYEIEYRNNNVVVVWEYKSQSQKNNNGKIKKRTLKDENGKKIGSEEYVFEGEKEIKYILNKRFDYFLNFMGGTMFYSDRFARIIQKLDEADYEIVFVTKVKKVDFVSKKGNETYRYDVYCDGKTDKPSFKLYQWQERCYGFFVPEEKTYMAFMRSEGFSYGVETVEEHRTTFQNGKKVSYNSTINMKSLQGYLE